MIFKLARTLATLALASLVSSPAEAITIDFDSLSDQESVTNQFIGLGATFTNTVAARAGFSLNEIEFPPRSGDLAVLDAGGAIGIQFPVPVTEVHGFFTYATQLTMTAFDAGNVILGSVSSTYSSNAALSGTPGSSPNELLSLGFASGIARVTITGNPNGGSFVLDDLSFALVPEPSTALLLALGLLGVASTRTRSR